MLILFETPAGYALFKLLDESIINKVDNIWKELNEDPTKVQLVSFKKFKDTADALSNITTVQEGKVSKMLKKLLKKQVESTEQLAVGDTKLGAMLKEKLEIQCVNNSSINELMRGVRANLNTYLAEHQQELEAMRLGLAHSLARYRVKFNPEKIDTMIIQAVSLLDDLDKELNNYVMRCKEWYGWHFPELAKLVTDSQAFAKTVKAIGMKQNTKNADLSTILPEELVERVKAEAEISMGTDISEEDIINIHLLCDQIIELGQYRNQLFEYLKNRMLALAPNLTILLGELVGARLISKAGSLVQLAKYPSSTVQILGAEKALFRALKTKKDTPKYGLIYHAQLITQAGPKVKGKIARKLAAKVSLSARIDALCEESLGTEKGIESRAALERVLKEEQERGPKVRSRPLLQKPPEQVYVYKKEVYEYDQRMDIHGIKAGKKRGASQVTEDEQVAESSVQIKKVKIEADEAVDTAAAAATVEVPQQQGEEEVSPPKKKKKVKNI